MMTIEEKAVCEIYTGICFTSGDERGAVYRYAEKLMGRPVYTHELWSLSDELSQRAWSDFRAVCNGTFAPGGDKNEMDQR